MRRQLPKSHRPVSSPVGNSLGYLGVHDTNGISAMREQIDTVA